MIFHQRADVYVPPPGGGPATILLAENLPVEVSPMRTEGGSFDGPPITYFSVFAAFDPGIKSTSELLIDGTKYRLYGPVEPHRLGGRLHHLEMVCQVFGG